MAVLTAKYKITWEKLPEDFILPDDPVDNINQPPLAAALSDSLQVAGRVTDNTLTPTNYGICATLDGKMVVKAPDWAYIGAISVPPEEVIRSYTPQLQGEIPAIVMEFLSHTDGGEYSSKSTYPPGKWLFYEQILQVPYYAIFEPAKGALEVYHLDQTGQYQFQFPDANGRYWIETMNLFLGVWHGTRERRNGYWLRWWDHKGELLLWSSEVAERQQQRAEEQQQRAEEQQQRAERQQQRAEEQQQRAEEQQQRAEAERQRAEAERQRAEAERQRAERQQQRAEEQQQRADRLLQQLRAAGLEPEE